LKPARLRGVSGTLPNEWDMSSAIFDPDFANRSTGTAYFRSGFKPSV